MRFALRIQVQRTDWMLLPEFRKGEISESLIVLARFVIFGFPEKVEDESSSCNTRIYSAWAAPAPEDVGRFGPAPSTLRLSDINHALRRRG